MCETDYSRKLNDELRARLKQEIASLETRIAESEAKIKALEGEATREGRSLATYTNSLARKKFEYYNR